MAPIIVALLGACAICATVAVFWLHLGLRPVLSGSMRPTYGPGWAVVTRPLPVGQLRPGDIIVFRPPGSNVAFAHRVTSVSGPSGQPVVTTKGDANRYADPWRMRLESKTVPVVVAEVPWLGWVMVDFQSRWAHVLLIGGIDLGICLAGATAILRGPPRRLPST